MSTSPATTANTRRLHLYRKNAQGERVRWAFVIDRHQTIVDEYEDPVPRAPASTENQADLQAVLYRIHAAPHPEAETLVSEFQDKLARMLTSGECKDGTGPCQRNALVRAYVAKLKEVT